MSGPNTLSIQGEGGGRRLRFGTVRVHNAHLQSGRAIVDGCRVCAYGLEGILEAIPWKPDKEDEVAPGDGANEKEDTSPPFGGWPG